MSPKSLSGPILRAGVSLRGAVERSIGRIFDSIGDHLSRRRISAFILLFSATAHGASVIIALSVTEAMRPEFPGAFEIAVAVSFLLELLAYWSERAYWTRIFLVLRLLVIVLIARLVRMDNPMVLIFLSGSLLSETALFETTSKAIILAVIYLLAIFAGVSVRPPRPLSPWFWIEFGLIDSLIGGLALTTAYYREMIVDYQRHTAGLNKTIVNLSDANRAFQTYAHEVRSVSAEEERTRIAMELHDSIGYTLTNVIVMMSAGKVLLRDDPAALGEILDKIRDQAEGSLEEVRRTLHRLREIQSARPKGLTAIRSLVGAFEGVSGIEVRFSQGNVPETMGYKIDRLLFRTMQESLTNAFRHGRATKLHVTLWNSPRELSLSIWDNGSGIPVDGMVQEGLGLQGMRQRVAEFGGTIEMGNTNDGFRVLVRLPLVRIGERNVQN